MRSAKRKAAPAPRRAAVDDEDGLVASPKVLAAAAGRAASAATEAASKKLAAGSASARSRAPVTTASSDSDSDSDSSDASSDSSDDGDEGVHDSGAGGAGTGAAWSDSDDELVEVDVAKQSRLRKLRKTEGESKLGGKDYAERLRKRFEATHGVPDWAKLDGAAAADTTVAHTGPLVGKTSALPRDILEVVRQVDGNHSEPSKAVIQSLEFHPSGQLLMTAGFDQKIRLFQVDGVKNPKIQSVHIENMPIRTARFTPDGNQVIVSGRRKYFYSYDIASGKVTHISGILGRPEKSLEMFAMSPDNEHMAFYGRDGTAILVSTRTKQWLANLKMPGALRALSFTPEGDLLAGCDDGIVHRWDVRMRRSLWRFADEGSSCVTSIAAAPNRDWIATGAATGVVNLYRMEDVAAKCASAGLSIPTPAPARAFLNLTTSINNLYFNSTSEILAMSSQLVMDALRCVHVPSQTVFSNWPTSKTPLHYLSAVGFSPNSGYLACGNDRGRVLLYRLKHYTSA